MSDEVTQVPEQTDIVERNRVIITLPNQRKNNLAKAVLDSYARSDVTSSEKPSFSPNDLAEYIYNRKIPEIYRIADDEISTDRDLNRFLHVGIEGGLDNTLDKIAELKSLVDPMTCPAQFLPKLASSWGVTYFEDIGVYYNRKFLSCIGEFMKRRGSMGGVKYIIRILTGIDSELEYERISEGEEQGRYLYYTLKPDNLKMLERLNVSKEILSRFISRNIPFYIRAVYRGVQVSQHNDIKSLVRRNGGSLSFVYHYDFTGVMKRKMSKNTYSILSINKAPHYDFSAIQ